MTRRLLTTIFVFVAIAGFAGVASAQYMFLDSNGNGIHDSGDGLLANGTPTTVRIFLDPARNRDGTTAVCNTDPSTPLNATSYVVNFTATNGTVTYAGFSNQQAGFVVNFGEINTDGIHYKNGYGGPLPGIGPAGGPFLLAQLVITGVSGTPTISFVDMIPGSADFTSFGTRCDGNGFDSTYKLDGPNTRDYQGAGDWFDTDGLPPGGGTGNSVPLLAPIGNRTVNELSLLTFTATATDADVPGTQTLTFTLDPGAPAGAVLDPATGVFTWTPTEAQGPLSYPVTLRVRDTFSPTPGEDSESFSISVHEVDAQHTVNEIPDRVVNENALLSIQAGVTDPDIPAQTYNWTVDPGAPTGAAITPGTGLFTWTPAEGQGPGIFTISIRASQNALFDSEAFSVQVNEVNAPPVLNAIGDKTAGVGQTITFTAVATDPDLPTNALTFSLGAGAPAGATIGGSTGNFSWTPSASGAFNINVIVTDNGTPPLNDSEVITIIVGGFNSPPVLAPIGNKSGSVGGCPATPVTFTATATDPDAGQTLTFSLGPGAPAGATIDPSTGAFSWLPTTGGPVSVTVIVTDNGSPPLSDSETIQINISIVNQPPLLAAIGNKTISEGSQLTFSVSALDACTGNLFFTLGAGAPAGASITLGNMPSPASATFSWTPAEGQGPGTYPITVIVTNGDKGSSDSETIMVTVMEVNNFAPVLAAIGNKTVSEHVLLSFTATATDADLPATPLTFSLGAGAPSGAAITAAGAFTWTPSDLQGGATHSITVVVTDSGMPPQNDTETIQVTVTEDQVPPILAVIGNKTVNEGSLLSFIATGTDADFPPGTFSFSLGAGAPAGASITTAGSFTWTPTEAQGPSVFSITVILSDGTLTDSETIQVTVTEINVAPILAQPGPMTVNEGATANQTLTATDADLPANTLTFTKVTGPLFVSVTTSGVVIVTPGFGDAGVTSAAVRVSDGMSNDTKSFQITVVNVCQTPVASAGGPYTGTTNVNVTFDGTGSSSPDGDPLTYTWDFGDGGSGSGVSPAHAYGAAGLYTVTLTVNTSGGCSLSDTDVTSAAIIDCLPATAFTTGGNGTTSLGSGKPQTCVYIQPDDGGYTNDDVILSTVRMIYPGGAVTQIFAVGSKSSVNTDKNGDGILEILACFTKEDLRLLFSGVSGTQNVTVTLEGDLAGGGKFCTTLVHKVKGGGGNALAATISPNPLNPKATLTFATSKPGMVKAQMFDVQGRLIRTLMDESNAAVGYHDVTIDGQDANGGKLASGIYYVKIRSSFDGEVTKAVTILK